MVVSELWLTEDLLVVRGEQYSSVALTVSSCYSH